MVDVLKKMLRRSAMLLVLALIGVAGCSEEPAQGRLERITIGTGPAGTLYSQIGTALTTVAQRELGKAATARPYTGSSIYIPQMHRGELAFGLNNSADIGAAYRGELVYARPLKNVRVAMLLSRAPFQYFVKADSDIRSLADLKGRPIMTSYRSIAPFDQINAAILATAGLTFADVRPTAVAGVPDAIRALVEDRVVAAATLLGIPALREAHATVPGGLRVLSLGPNEAPVTAMPGFNVANLKPGPAMVGVLEPIRVAQMDVYLNTSIHVSPDDVYDMIRVVHLHWVELQKGLPAFRSVSEQDFAPVNIGHPYHEGAIRYFKEIGLWTGAHEQLQSRLLGEGSP
jgi:uncharacterized protein